MPDGYVDAGQSLEMIAWSHAALEEVVEGVVHLLVFPVDWLHSLSALEEVEVEYWG